MKAFSEICMIKGRVSLFVGTHSPVCVRTPLLDFNFAAINCHFLWILYIEYPELSINICVCFKPIFYPRKQGPVHPRLRTHRDFEKVTACVPGDASATGPHGVGESTKTSLKFFFNVTVLYVLGNLLKGFIVFYQKHLQ